MSDTTQTRYCPKCDELLMPNEDVLCGKIEKLKQQLSERDAAMARCVDEALERAAQICEKRGRQIGGAIDPNRTAEAIRALKANPSPTTDESPASGGNVSGES